jgi:hypothetical protein
VPCPFCGGVVPFLRWCLPICGGVCPFAVVWCPFAVVWCPFAVMFALFCGGVLHVCGGVVPVCGGVVPVCGDVVPFLRWCGALFAVGWCPFAVMFALFCGGVLHVCGGVVHVCHVAGILGNDVCVVGANIAAQGQTRRSAPTRAHGYGGCKIRHWGNRIGGRCGQRPYDVCFAKWLKIR